MNKRRRGRPPLDEHALSVPVTLRLTVKDYDRIYEAARTARVTVPEVLRDAVRAALEHREPRRS